jgi:hypothetical protein
MHLLFIDLFKASNIFSQLLKLITQIYLVMLCFLVTLVQFAGN